MIKAILFDWMNTLARYEPPREVLHSRIFGEFGIAVTPQALLPALLVADKYMYDEYLVTPIDKRSPEDKKRVYLHYYDLMLSGIGFKADQELILKIWARERQAAEGLAFALYDDVLPSVKTLDQRGLVLGMITNMPRDMAAICNAVGLSPYLDFFVTPQEAGADKPNPAIFLLALERAGVQAAEAIYVGDQYKFDVLGARGVGMTPILIDRYEASPEVTDCPRIHSLSEVMTYL
ncbi:MAG: HAD-IA family hydrolase [Chloroflexi bacterium]|nr:HAD-IA family hydrolase [Chloroflexota bacterium]